MKTSCISNLSEALDSVSKRLPSKESAVAVRLVLAGFVLLAGSSACLHAQRIIGGTATGGAPNGASARMQIVPQSSVAVPSDKGLRAHTNLILMSPIGLSTSDDVSPDPSEFFETPASVACQYVFVAPMPGAFCNPTVVYAVPIYRGSQTIAIVDAYDYPNAPSDLAYFSAQFGLPFNPEKFQVVYESGFEPPEDYTGGWELEEALDIEWAHAMAPLATLYLVEANSNSFEDLFTSVGVASNLVVCGQTSCPSGGTGKGEVSMSWGGGEFAAETSYDSTFTTPNVVYVSSTGDDVETEYPSVSPNVVAAGGASIARNAANGNFSTQASWPAAGSGLSLYETIPSYQTPIASIVGGARGVPDLSFDANPYTGVWIYDTFPYNGFEVLGWTVVGGTSVASPSLAGVINSAGSFASSSAAELTTIYNNRANTSAFHDVTYGICGEYNSGQAVPGWDVCTGVGTPIGYVDK